VTRAKRLGAIEDIVSQSRARARADVGACAALSARKCGDGLNPPKIATARDYRRQC
jgi:hypothetical protein